MKKKTIFKFKNDVIKQIGWNAQIGFWFGFMYKRYEKDAISYQQALDTLAKMKGYTGV